MEPFFFIGLIVAVALALGTRHARRTDGAWRQFALREGLTFKPAGLVGQRSVQGTLAGHPVLVETIRRRSGNRSGTWTRYRVHYPPLGFNLRLAEQGAFSGIARFLGAQDIEVGDPEFDADVTVKADDPRAATAYLTPARRVGIRRFLKDHAGAGIGDSELSFRTRGAERNTSRMHSRLRKACELAALLSTDEISTATAPTPRAHAPPVDTARGAETRAPEDGAPRPPASFEAAQDVREAVVELRPDDAEVPARTEDAREPVSAPETTTPVPANTGPSVEALCEALFAERHMSFEVNRLFDERFAGVDVNWSGTLERLDRYFSDSVFGKGPGVRAVIEVGSVALDSYGSRPVQAIVQLPEDARERLASLRGEPLRFSGRLTRCDAFMHHVFLADGVVDA